MRAWKAGYSGIRTYFIYDGSTPIIEMDGSGNAKAVNTFGANGLISRRTFGTNRWTDSSIFYTFDERGNTVERLDITGGIEEIHIFDAFGEFYGNETTDPFDFGGQFGYYTDWETFPNFYYNDWQTGGIILCGQRYYHPGTGRWLTRDPIGYAGGINLYGYTKNNPVMGVDPSGLDGTLVVYGSDHGLGIFGWVPYISDSGAIGFGGSDVPGGHVVSLFKPSRKELINALLDADAFYYWGHGYVDIQALHINESKDDNSNRLTVSDVKYIATERAKRHRSKLKWVELHSCASLSTRDAVNSWLRMSEKVSGYAEDTVDVTKFPQTIRPMHTFRTFVDYEPEDFFGQKTHKKGEK